MAYINFLSTAIGKHSMFAVPFIASALLTNEQSTVELIVDTKTLSYLRRVAFPILDRYFKDRYLVYSAPSRFKRWTDELRLATIRFLVCPRIKSKLTYISDCDILFLDKNIGINYEQHMANIKKPYSNAVRCNQQRLTGLHCVNYEKYYTKFNQKFLNDIVDKINTGVIKLSMDERLLFTLVQQHFGIPQEMLVSNYGIRPTDFNYRPVPGFHISLSRPALHWGVTPRRIKQYMCLKDEAIWGDLVRIMPKAYVKKLAHLDKYYEENKQRVIDA